MASGGKPSSPCSARVGATAAVRRRATGKRGQYGHAHDLAPGRRGRLAASDTASLCYSRSGWRGQLDRCAVLIQKRHSGWRHGALPGTSSTVTAGLDPAAGASMRRKSIRSGRSDRRPGCVSSQRSKGSARASSRLRRQRPSGPGAVTSACKPACSRPRRSDASVAGPRAVCSRGALASNVSSSMLAAQAQFGARALGPGQRRLDQRQPAQRGQRQQGAAGQHALARRQSEPIIPGARAPVRDALAPCRERRRRQAGTRSSRAARGCRALRRRAAQAPAAGLGLDGYAVLGRRLDPVWRAPSGAGSRRAGAISTSNAPSA